MTARKFVFALWRRARAWLKPDNRRAFLAADTPEEFLAGIEKLAKGEA